MIITVINGKDKQKLEIEENITIKDALDIINISSETVVIKRNDEVVIEEEIIKEGDVIEVIRVIYGG